MTNIIIDKSSWGPGPWQEEPNVAQWRRGSVECLMLRHPEMGFWNGYVGVPTSDLDEGSWMVSVDGFFFELTYASAEFPSYGERKEVHKPEGEWYWIGFHTSSGHNYAPGLATFVKATARSARIPSPSPSFGMFDPSTYLDFEYVKAEVIKLADAFNAKEQVGTDDRQREEEEAD